jgi:aerobic carbon-monoxide dehydrogenase medium subunit
MANERRETAMIPFHFDYYRPESLQEATRLYSALHQQGKRPLYFSGGTEINTLGRLNLDYTEAVIDIKAVKECNVMEISDDYLVMGAALTLTKIEEANLFPLLTKTAGEVADHTARTKITLGGNVCGKIFYREAVLPFLLADSQVLIAGPAGYKLNPINDVFNQQLQLEQGELLVQLITEKQHIAAPFATIKKRRQWYTGYPLVTIASIQVDHRLRVAISGLCPFPFRSARVEAELNNNGISAEERINNAIKQLPVPILDDAEGSSEYRIFVLRNTLKDVIDSLEGVDN